jgi:hypothetical protein
MNTLFAIFSYLVVFLLSAIGKEVIVKHNYRYEFNSFYEALNSHVVKNKIIFIKFNGAQNLIICEDIKNNNFFIFCPASLGVVKIFDKDMKLYDTNNIKSSISLVPGPYHKGNGSVENDFDISEKELSGYWINTKNDLFWVKVLWQPTSLNDQEKEGLSETMVKIYKSSTGLWTANSFQDK